MTSLPPEAAGAAGGAQGAIGGATGDPPPSSRRPLSAASLPAAAPRPEGGARPAYGPRLVPPVRPSGAPVELTLDLRGTPPDKVIARLIGALDRVSPDVTLYVLLRDTPEYVGVTANIYQALRSRGYVSDSSRLPQGGQRLCVRRRRESPRPVFRTEESPEAPYVPPPERAEPDANPPTLPLNGGKVLPGERLSGWAVAARSPAPDPFAQPAGSGPAAEDPAKTSQDAFKRER